MGVRFFKFSIMLILVFCIFIAFVGWSLNNGKIIIGVLWYVVLRILFKLLCVKNIFVVVCFKILFCCI